MERALGWESGERGLSSPAAGVGQREFRTPGCSGHSRGLGTATCQELPATRCKLQLLSTTQASDTAPLAPSRQMGKLRHGVVPVEAAIPSPKGFPLSWCLCSQMTP